MNVKRATIAFLLSVLQPGLGQAYNRQYRLSFAYILSAFTLFLLFGATGLAKSAGGFFTLGGVSVVGFLIITGHAVAAAAGTKKGAPLRTVNKLLLAPILALAAGSLALSLSDYYLYPFAGLRGFKVPSESMSPTIEEGDRIMADMSAFQKAAPHRGDVVVVEMNVPGKTRTVKRVIAVGGDTLEGTEKGLLLNGKILQESYLRRPVSGSNNSITIFEELHIAPGQAFVLGDDREDSYDSRYWGPADLKSVNGKVLFIYWSRNLKRIGRKVE